MFRLTGLALSIGLADSLNPTTIAPALYLAVGDHAKVKVLEFTAAVFFVYLAGGFVIAFGPGELLLDLVPRPNHTTRSTIELIAGVAMIVGAAYLWRKRRKLAERPLPTVNAEGKSSAILGATITAIELPTAFPYFAVIATIVGSGEHFGGKLLLLVLFNFCFIAPLLGIAAVLTFAPGRSEQVLSTARASMEKRWPVLLAGLLAVAGVFVVVLGATGLAHRYVRFRHFVPHLR